MSGLFSFAATEIALTRAASSGTQAAAEYLADTLTAAGSPAGAQGAADGSASVTLDGTGRATGTQTASSPNAISDADRAGMLTAFAQALSAALAEQGQ
jgi:hypothetical protein